MLPGGRSEAGEGMPLGVSGKVLNFLEKIVITKQSKFLSSLYAGGNCSKCIKLFESPKKFQD